MMDKNPYSSPSHSASASEESRPWRPRNLILGFFIGGSWGAVAGFLGGALCGLIFRLFHDVVHGGVPIFGTRLATPMDFALYHGTLAAFALCVIGALIGCAQGVFVSAARIFGLFLFVGSGMLVGLLNGGFVTGGPGYVIPYFLEGPLSGGLAGGGAAMFVWMLWRRTNLRRTTR